MTLSHDAANPPDEILRSKSASAPAESQLPMALVAAIARTIAEPTAEEQLGAAL